MNKLQTYDDDRRREAVTAGKPILRMSGPVIPPRAPVRRGKSWSVCDWKKRVYVFVRRGQFVAGEDPAAVHQVTARQVVSLHLADDTQVVVPDRGTHDLLVERVRDESNTETVARRLTAVGKMGASGRWVILTDALARRWWFPAAADPPVAEGWARAFRLPSGPGSYSDLFDRAAQETEATSQQLAAINSYSKIERQLLGDLGATGAEVAVTAFRNAEMLNDLWDIIERFDPLLRTRRILDGGVAPVSAVSLERDRAILHAHLPFRVREGVALITSAAVPRGVDCHLLSVGWDAAAHAIELVVTPPPTSAQANKRNGEPAWHLQLKATLASDATITASPLRERTPAQLRANRWTRDMKNSPETTRGDIPLDVILAGDEDSTTSFTDAVEDVFAGFPQL